MFFANFQGGEKKGIAPVRRTVGLRPVPLREKPQQVTRSVWPKPFE